MKVALGTFEITEEERKTIKRAMGFKSGKVTRDEARAFLTAAARKAIEHTYEPEHLIAGKEAGE